MFSTPPAPVLLYHKLDVLYGMNIYFHPFTKRRLPGSTVLFYIDIYIHNQKIYTF